jgi:hypothetical protein
MQVKSEAMSVQEVYVNGRSWMKVVHRDPRKSGDTARHHFIWQSGRYARVRTCTRPRLRPCAGRPWPSCPRGGTRLRCVSPHRPRTPLLPSPSRSSPRVTALVQTRGCAGEVAQLARADAPVMLLKSTAGPVEVSSKLPVGRAMLEWRLRDLPARLQASRAFAAAAADPAACCRAALVERHTERGGERPCGAGRRALGKSPLASRARAMSAH